MDMLHYYLPFLGIIGNSNVQRSHVAKHFSLANSFVFTSGHTQVNDRLNVHIKIVANVSVQQGI